MSDCLFCKIAAGQIPSNKVYEDDEFVAFHDIRPKAEVHLLVIPKLHVASLAECGTEHEAMLGKLLLLAPKLAREQGIGHGFQTRIHTGAAGGQEVFHLHLHVIGNRP
ncbi:HIT domain-containing protein [Crenobacter cavernae]|uniref:HIT domain-containing protein n=1 Tax=Crenobacter cavernae TaxID=2290923 RepID=A0A345Y5G4_9NEIS|nr:HIT domain-containing protein [Crenobacter cavernae]AXK39166.1 HIT domain-containing protein [Crenobacter cavernae]